MVRCMQVGRGRRLRNIPKSPIIPINQIRKRKPYLTKVRKAKICDFKESYERNSALKPEYRVPGSNMWKKSLLIFMEDPELKLGDIARWTLHHEWITAELPGGENTEDEESEDDAQSMSSTQEFEAHLLGSGSGGAATADPLELVEEEAGAQPISSLDGNAEDLDHYFDSLFDEEEVEDDDSSDNSDVSTKAQDGDRSAREIMNTKADPAPQRVQACGDQEQATVYEPMRVVPIPVGTRLENAKKLSAVYTEVYSTAHELLDSFQHSGLEYLVPPTRTILHVANRGLKKEAQTIAEIKQEVGQGEVAEPDEEPDSFDYFSRSSTPELDFSYLMEIEDHDSDSPVETIFIGDEDEDTLPLD